MGVGRNQPPINMPNIIVKGNREDAIHALINTWLKDTQRWCLNCNKNFDETGWVVDGPCCDKAFLTTNAHVMKHFSREMAISRAEKANDFASTESNSMRHLLKFPPGLLEFLDHSMMHLYNEKLFTKEYSHIWFAKHFGKHFCVAEKI